MVPGKFAFDLDDLDLLPVERGDGLGPPMLIEQGKFFLEIDLLHIRRLAHASILA